MTYAQVGTAVMKLGCRLLEQSAKLGTIANLERRHQHHTAANRFVKICMVFVLKGIIVRLVLLTQMYVWMDHS